MNVLVHHRSVQPSVGEVLRSGQGRGEGSVRSSSSVRRTSVVKRDHRGRCTHVEGVLEDEEDCRATKGEDAKSVSGQKATRRRCWGTSSRTEDSLATCQAMVVKWGKGTEWVAIPKYSAIGWKPQIYRKRKKRREMSSAKEGRRRSKHLTHLRELNGEVGEEDKLSAFPLLTSSGDLSLQKRETSDEDEGR